MSPRCLQFFFQHVCPLFHGTGIPHTFSVLSGVFMFGGVYFTLRCLCLGGPLARWARVADLSSVQFFHHSRGWVGHVAVRPGKYVAAYFLGIGDPTFLGVTGHLEHRSGLSVRALSLLVSEGSCSRRWTVCWVTSSLSAIAAVPLVPRLPAHRRAVSCCSHLLPRPLPYRLCS